jgi:hypothetical protein
MAITKLKVGVAAAAALAGLATHAVWQYQSLSRLSAENQLLGHQVQDLTPLAAENERLSNLVAQARSQPTNLKTDLNELLKLRGDVSRLRTELAEAKQPPAKAPSGTKPDGTEFTLENEAKRQGIAKLNYTKGLMLAFHMYANDNHGQFPTNFDQSLPYLPEEAKTEMNLKPGQFLPGTPKYGLTPDHYEILYQGAVNALTAPAATVVIREKEPWQNEDGSWSRAYAFADGHSEIHKAVDGSFEPWEAQHIVTSQVDGKSSDQGAPGPGGAGLRVLSEDGRFLLRPN